MAAGRDRSLRWTVPLLVAMVATIALGAGVGAMWPRHPAVEWGLLWVAGALLFAAALRIAGAFIRRAPLQEDVAR